MPKGQTLRRDQFDWTPVRIEYLRTWWGKPGVSAALIAGKLGCTKSATIGKAHRLGLPNLGNPVGKSRFDPGFSSEPSERTPYTRRDENGAMKVTGVPRGGVRRGSSEFLFGNKKPRTNLAPKPRPCGAVHGAKIRAGIAARRADLRLPFDIFKDAANTNSRVSSAVAVVVADSGSIERDVPMKDLAPRGCRWPTNKAARPDGHLFCNAHAGHSIYCAGHLARAVGAGTPSERAADKGIASSAA